MVPASPGEGVIVQADKIWVSPCPGGSKNARRRFLAMRRHNKSPEITGIHSRLLAESGFITN
jgi:hypothetical protein